MKKNRIGMTVLGICAAALTLVSCASSGNQGNVYSYTTSCDHGNRIYETDTGLAVVPHDPSCSGN